MKKMAKVMLSIGVAVVFLFTVSAFTYGQTKSSKSLDQLKRVEKSSKEAKTEAEKGNLGKAKVKSGEGFDTPSTSTGTVKESTGTAKGTSKEISDRENKAQRERDREKSKKYRLDDPKKAPPKPK